MQQDSFKKIKELNIILKAALGDGIGYEGEHIELMLKWNGFVMPQDRERLLDYISINNGASVKGWNGVGGKTYNAILLYLLNT
jgi:hypothetical protein